VEKDIVIIPKLKENATLGKQEDNGNNFTKT
jgi:hypothetical protein